jgi:hypothetical protein
MNDHRATQRAAKVKQALHTEHAADKSQDSLFPQGRAALADESVAVKNSWHPMCLFRLRTLRGRFILFSQVQPARFDNAAQKTRVDPHMRSNEDEDVR